MEFVKDIDEVTRIFAECGIKMASFQSIGTDKNGTQVAVPAFVLGLKQEVVRHE